MNHRPRVWGRITGWNAEMERSNERQRQAAPPPADYQAELDALEEQLQNPISAQFRQRQRFERERRSPAPRPLQRGNVEDEFVNLNQMSLRPLNAQPTSTDVHQPTSVQTDVSRMLESELFSDVTFVVGNQRERVPAHQFVLSVRSKVFAAMFHNSGFQQPSANGTQEVEVPDIEPSIFRVMLRFIYTDQLKLSPDEVMAIVYAARKYEIQSMESACITYLKKNLDAENVFFILEQSRLFDLNELSVVAWDFIDNQPHVVLNGESFVDIGYSTLCELLRRDSFGAKERDIYEAALRWARAQAKRQKLTPTGDSFRSVLGDALFLIRFPLMTVQEFTIAVNLSPTSVLTEHERLNVYSHIALSSISTTPSAWSTGNYEETAVDLASAVSLLPQIPFPTNRRVQQLNGGKYFKQREGYTWRDSL
ncbi:BTB/POZ domain-containing protein 2 [Aphelenchoides besseyi]|nr:BTB/POZ domain-containing protein 2 [Aphelenchoides besseyi]